jgi:hypothetical protein
MSSNQDKLEVRFANASPRARDLKTKYFVLLIELTIIALAFEAFWWHMHESAGENHTWSSLPLRDKFLSRLHWWREVVFKGSWLVMIFVIAIFSITTLQYLNKLIGQAVGLFPCESPEPIAPLREEGD